MHPLPPQPLPYSSHYPTPTHLIPCSSHHLTLPTSHPLILTPQQGTADHVAAAAVEVGLKQGKLPVVVGDVPGFYVNRCLGPFMMETTALISHGK